MKFVSLNDFWEKDQEVQKIRKTNEEIMKLRDVITAREGPVVMRSNKIGIEITATLELKRPPFKKPHKDIYFNLTAPVKQDKKLLSILLEALLKKSCDSFPKEDIDILHKFLSDIEIGTK